MSVAVAVAGDRWQVAGGGCVSGVSVSVSDNGNSAAVVVVVVAVSMAVARAGLADWHS